MSSIDEQRRIVISDEARTHLIAFAESFVAPEFVDRWKLILVEKPQKAYRDLVKFERQHHSSRCNLVPRKEFGTLPVKYGLTEGMYFSGTGSPRWVRFVEVWGNSPDAIFSIRPGAHAIFLFHEGWAWECTK